MEVFPAPPLTVTIRLLDCRRVCPKPTQRKGREKALSLFILKCVCPLAVCETVKSEQLNIRYKHTPSKAYGLATEAYI